MFRIIAILFAVVFGSLVAHAQFQLSPTLGGIGAPGGVVNTLQYNATGTFGSIANGTLGQCLTFATPPIWGSCAAGSQTSIAAGSSIATTGTASNVTVSVSPSGSTGQLQYNATSALGAVTGATSNGSNVSFTTNSLVINGQAISKVSGTTGTLATVTGSLGSGNCVQLDANGNLKDSGSATCGGTANAVTSVSNADGSLTVNPTTGAVSITLATPVTLSRGGTSASLIPFNGGLVTFTSTSMAITTMATALVIDGPTGASAYTGATCNSAMQQLGGAGTASCVNVGAHGVLIGEGTSAFNSVSTTSSGALLLSQGAADPAWAVMSGSCTITNAGVITCGTVSIAAGSNITTSGTASNITVNAVPSNPASSVQYNNAGVFGGDSSLLYQSGTGHVTHTIGTVAITDDRAVSITGTWGATTVTFAAPLFVNIATNTGGTTNAFASGSLLLDVQASGLSQLKVAPSLGTTITNNLTATTAQFSGFLTASGANLQTVTLAGALNGATANFTGNLTSPTAQFTGFLTAGGASLSGLTIATETLSGALNGATANFTGNLTSPTAQFAGFLTASGGSFQTISLGANLTGTQANFTSNLTASIYTGTATGAGGLAFVSPSIAQFELAPGLSAATPATGWLNWGGEARIAADVGFTTTGFVNLASVTLQGGRTYKFEAQLPVRLAAAATGGIALRIGGGATAGNVVYDGWVVDFGQGGSAGVKGGTQASALSTTVASTTLTGSTGHATLFGTISVNAGGTLILQGSGFSTVTAASAATLSRGGNFIVTDMP